MGVWLAGAFLALGLAACANDNGGAIDIPVTSSTATTTPATTTTAVDNLQGAARTPVSTPRGDATALLTAVRVARQDTFDRVVFEFENAVPGYQVEYVPRPIREDASGRTVTVAGNAVLQVRMEPGATADLSGGDVRRTYTGPNRVRGDTTAVTEAVKTGDFEAVLTWVIGVRDTTDFRVTTLSNPARLVVDLRS